MADRPRGVAQHQLQQGASQQRQQQQQQQQQQQATYDHRYHFHITERPIHTVKHMDKKSKSILCNSSGIIVAEMVYRCLICRSVFETPLDCRTHFRCFHEHQESSMDDMDEASAAAI